MLDAKRLTQLSKNNWLTTGALATYYGVNRATILRWVKDGRVASSRTVGGHYRVLIDDFRNAVADRRLP
jgi:excisionase family DNA binding protein